MDNLTTETTTKKHKKQTIAMNPNKVADENEEFRRKLRNDNTHKVIITEQLSASGFYSAAIACVRNFYKFDDKSLFKDFGNFNMLDRTGYFKIEYFELNNWDVPADPLKGPVNRKITIGLGLI
jgi:hypothetical protein